MLAGAGNALTFGQGVDLAAKAMGYGDNFTACHVDTSSAAYQGGVAGGLLFGFAFAGADVLGGGSVGGSLGSTGRTVAANLEEQLAMEEVMSNPAGSQLRNIVMSDARWQAADGWVKMQQIVNGVNIHYVFNTVTKAVDDFKFIGGSG